MFSTDDDDGRTLIVSGETFPSNSYKNVPLISVLQSFFE